MSFRRKKLFADSLHGLVMHRTLNARALLTDRAGGLHGDEPAAAAAAAESIVCASTFSCRAQVLDLELG